MNFQNVCQFKDQKIINPPSFIKELSSDLKQEWMKQSFQETSHRVEGFYKKFFPKRKPLNFPEKSKCFTYHIQGEQSFQMNFESVLNEKESVHNFIFLEEGARLYFFENESHPWWFHHIYLSPRSQVFRFKLTQRPHRSFVFSKLKKKSCFFNFEVNMHSKESYVLIEGLGKDCVGVSRSLNLLNDQQTVFEKVEHYQKASGFFSRQFLRSVVGGQASSRVHSMAWVEAQEVNSHQLLQSLLFENGSSENKPELKVFKDQVQATHGSTVGTVNPSEVFYLNSRGISKSQALRILIQAWVYQIFDTRNLKDLKTIDFNNFIQKVRRIFEPELQKKLSYFTK